MFSEIFSHFGAILFELLEHWEVWLLLFILSFLITAPSLSQFNVVVMIRDFILYTWWFWAMFPLFHVVRELFLYARQQAYKENEGNPEKYALLEIRIPRELQRSPKAMAQVFTSLHMLGNSAGNWREKYLDGQVPLWSSLEIVKTGGELHLYIRVPKKNTHLVEVAFFSNYSDVEIEEVPDYMRQLPATTAELYAREMDIWGTEMILGSEDAYPIKTFAEFESGEKQSDPISVFIEVLSKLSAEETACIHILFTPAPKDWAKKWESVLEKLREMKFVDAGGAKVPLPATPGRNEMIAAVERKLTKAAFNVVIRLAYISPGAEMKSGSAFARGGIVGAFNQYAAPKLNSFKANGGTTTRIDKWKFPHIAVDSRLEYKKQRLLHNLRLRVNPPETFTAKLMSSFFHDLNFDTKHIELSFDEMATIFHPPSSVVLTAPHLRRVESKKAGPPSGLPIFGEEEELERFKGTRS